MLGWLIKHFLGNIANQGLSLIIKNQYER